MSETQTATAPVIAIVAAPALVPATPLLSDLKTTVTTAVKALVSTIETQAGTVLTSMENGIVAPGVLAGLLPDLKAAVVTAINAHATTVASQESSLKAALTADTSAVKSTLVAAEGLGKAAVSEVGSVEQAVVAQVETDWAKHPVVVGLVAAALVVFGAIVMFGIAHL